jgi:integrase family protein with SAM-like domain
MTVIMLLVTAPGEPPTSTDLDTVNAARHLVGDDRLRPLTAAWLLSFKSPHTVRNYRHNLVHWLAFCADHGIDPLVARRAHIDAWVRVLEAQGLKERSVGRRLSAASWFFFKVRPDASLHAIRPFLLRPRGRLQHLTGC